MTNSNINDDKPSTGQLKLHRIYTKNSSFEATSLTIALLEKPVQPTVDLQVGADSHPQENDIFEAVLTLQIAAKHQGSILWRVQLQQAGIYTIQDFAEDTKQMILNGFCMNQLYPYACSEISRLVTQGGFLPVYLTPMNFEQLYREQQDAEKNKVDASRKQQINVGEKIKSDYAIV
jgi:preprotein translocase subunit SecB